jgi:leader peptidase (prepilin peptidase)/N-methyltransferase
LEYFFYALLGLAVGGLINLLADDLPERRRPGLPRCPQCGQVYRPAYWLGVARRLTGGGRCPACEAPERWRPVLVELGTALIFGLLWARYGQLSARLVSTSLFFAIFVLILVTDMEHRLILHAVTFPAAVLAFAASFFTINPRSALLGAAIGFVFFYLIYLMGGAVFGAGAMGFGDVTLSTFIGAAAGFPLVVVALLTGILAGGVITSGLLLLGRRRLRSKVPYGPFLIIGAAIALLWGDQIIAWYLH